MTAYTQKSILIHFPIIFRIKRKAVKDNKKKPLRMLQSRKIVSLKVLEHNEYGTFVKAMIKKSYGHVSRLAVILFHGHQPKFANCLCPCWD